MSSDEHHEVVPLKGRARKATATGWLADCICNEKRKPLPVLANVLIGVRADWPDGSPTTRCCARRC